MDIAMCIAVYMTGMVHALQGEWPSDTMQTGSLQAFPGVCRAIARAERAQKGVGTPTFLMKVR